jgi:hypothetical protein
MAQDTTIVIPRKDLYNKGKCFTKGKEYTVNRVIKNEAGLMEASVINDQGEPHTIGSWWREFTIVSPKAEEEQEEFNPRFILIFTKSYKTITVMKKEINILLSYMILLVGLTTYGIAMNCVEGKIPHKKQHTAILKAAPVLPKPQETTVIWCLNR